MATPSTVSGAPNRKRHAFAFAADAAAVIVFAAIGRRSHDEDSGVGAVVTTAAPFLVALLIGWAAAIALGRSRERLRDPGSAEAGLVVAAVTVGAGLVLRRLLWDRGTALAFVIVAAVFLAAAMFGWRAAATRWRARTA